MKLKNISLAALLVAGVGVTGCSNKPVTEAVTEAEKKDGNKTVVDRNGTDSNKTVVDRNGTDSNKTVVDRNGTDSNKTVTVLNPKEAMDKINAYAKDHLVNPKPTLQDYVTAGIVGVTEDNLAAVNDDIAKAEGEDADTVTEIHSIVAKINLAMRRIEKYADDGSRAEPTVEDYTTAGVLDVNANDIVGLNRRVDALKGVDVDTVAEIHTLVAEVTKAMAKIKAYAKDSANSPAPTVADYVNAGVNNVIAHNLAIMNENVAKGGEALDTTAEIQAVVDELPANVFITDANLALDIVSIKDTNHSLDIPGEINGTVTVKVPYTVTSDAIVSLQAFSETKKIDANTTENNESDLNVTFSYPEQHLRGAGTFDATITVANGVYRAKQLGLGATPLEVASFTYDLDDNASDQGTFTIRIIPGVVDRNFDVETNGKKEHRFVYLPVTNPKTGRTWLNNNLGANYANVDSSDFNPSQQATAANDYKAYGSLFQWGRKADGHELINWTSSTSGTGKYGKTSTANDNPSNSLFITKSYSDWRVNQDDTLWASESSPNNVCPVGYRLPLAPDAAVDAENELAVELDSWDSKDAEGSMSSELKLPMAGGRRSDGKFAWTANYGDYWTGSVVPSDGNNSTVSNARDVFFGGYLNRLDTSGRGIGFSVRCIKHSVGGTESILADIGTEHKNGKAFMKVAQLKAIEPALSDINDTYETIYQSYIEGDTNISSPATISQVQQMIDEVNSLNLPEHAILDRSFFKKTNGIFEHRFVYLAVKNNTTGRTWLNNNLGADYANVDSSDYNPSQQATATDDHLAYGSLFQWGRKADGHELINWTGNKNGTKKYGHTQTKSNNPSNSLFIGGDYDWRVTLDNTLWASESSANNVCPVGYRLPLDPNRADDGENEWYEETQTWSSKNKSGAINSVLKLPMSGKCHFGSNVIKEIGYEAAYWSGSANEDGDMSKGLDFYRNKAHSNANSAKTYGYNVRCIKD